MGTTSTSKLMTATTAMLIGLSAMFITLNLPFDIVYFHYFGIERNSLQKEEKAIYMYDL